MTKIDLSAKASPFVPPPPPPFIDQIVYLTVNWVGYDDRNAELFQLHRSRTPSWIFDYIMVPNQVIVGASQFRDERIAEVVTKLYSYRYTDVCKTGGVGVTLHRRKLLPTNLSGLEYTYQNSIDIHNPVQRLKPIMAPPFLRTSYKQKLCQ